MKTDGSILIDTKIIDGGMEKGFELIKDEMASVGIAAKEVGEQIDLSFSKMDVSKPIANAVAKVQQLEHQLASVTSDFELSVSEGDDKSAERLANKRIAVYDRLEAAREKLSIEIAAAVQKEAAAEEKAAQRAIKAAEKETKAKQRETEKQMKNAMKPAQRFGSRLSEILSGALIFNLISAGIRKMTSYFGDALKTNDQYTKSMSQLKGALLTAFQPIYEFIAPAIVYLMQLLTSAAQAAGRFFATLSGKSYSDMQKNAEAMYNEANAIDSVGSAAKDAQKQLMGFDEINKLNEQDSGTGSSGTSGTTLPSFTEFDDSGVKGTLEDILRLVGAVGAALLTWKIASMFTTSLSMAAGLAMAVGGGILFVTSLIDAFANGIDWGNLSGMLLGMVVLAGGLALAFGPVAAAIALLVTGVGLAIVAIKEWIETGELSNEGCVALVAAIMAIGVALMLLTGSWIPVVIAAIAAFILAAVTKGDELKAIFSKVVQWFKDTFLRDWRQIFGEDLGTVLNMFFSMCSGILDGLEQIFSGLIDFIQGVFTGNWEQAWSGLASIAKGAINGLIAIVNGMIWAITSGINALFELLSVQIPLPGGGTIGWELPQFTAPQIPYLAQGAVIPPNAPFMAVLGDQKNGTNIEAPLSTIEQALRNVMAEQGWDVNVEFRGELAALARILAPVITKEQRRASRAGGY